MFGRKPRTKSLEQVGLELDALRRFNVRGVFFVDDNLIGNIPLAKKLLRFLRDYQHKHDYQFAFGTEASLNMAQDEELLTLFREANFRWVFIGIESPDEESLKETKKYQNTRESIQESIRKIYSHSIEVMAGFIIGFDNDTRATFDLQYRFIMQSGIQAAMIGLLQALPRTPLYERLQKENRLRASENETDNTKLETNVIPKQMEYDDMVRDYRKLYHRLVEPKNIAARIRNKSRYLGKPVYENEYSLMEMAVSLYKFATKGLLPGGFSRVLLFLRSIPLSKPSLIPMVIKDWIIGLAMRDYVDRHFVLEFDAVNQLTHNYLKDIEVLFQRYLNLGALEVSVHRLKDTAAHLQLSLKAGLDKKFFIGVSHHLEKVLDDTRSSITLHIEELHEAQLKHFNYLLKKLSRYGDRIHIAISSQMAQVLEIDSSVYNLVFEV
jgi:hypothetical protein